MVIALSVLVLGACSGSGPQSALEPKGPIAADIDGLWELVFAIATVVFVVVFIGLVYSIVRFRERKGDETEPVQSHGNTRLEITWTIIPAVVLAVITVPTVQGIFDLRGVPEGPGVVQVIVTGHQWWWEFEYPDARTPDGRTIITANELHIPAATDVNLTMTSVDVIHSFWVPGLNGKRDVVPGRITNLTLNANEPTTEGEPLFGQCAEFCGLAHADMRIRVFVHDEAGYAAWVASQLEPAQLPAEGTAAARGYTTFTALCTSCHQATVTDGSGVISIEGSRLAPNLTHFSSRTTFGGATFANIDSHLAEWLADPSDLKPMEPRFNDLAEGRILGMPDLGLSDPEIAELIALLRLWE